MYLSNIHMATLFKEDSRLWDNVTLFVVGRDHVSK